VAPSGLKGQPWKRGGLGQRRGSVSSTAKDLGAGGGGENATLSGCVRTQWGVLEKLAQRGPGGYISECGQEVTEEWVFEGGVWKTEILWGVFSGRGVNCVKDKRREAAKGK